MLSHFVTLQTQITNKSYFNYPVLLNVPIRTIILFFPPSETLALLLSLQSYYWARLILCLSVSARMQRFTGEECFTVKFAIKVNKKNAKNCFSFSRFLNIFLNVFLLPFKGVNGLSVISIFSLDFSTLFLSISQFLNLSMFSQ